MRTAIDRDYLLSREKKIMWQFAEVNRLFDPWRTKALCATNPGGWDGDREEPAAIARAITICHECPVRVRCAQEALETSVQGGIWGGVLIRAQEGKINRRRLRKAIQETP